jgi:hypothetical protein
MRRSQWSVGLRPLAYWDCGFESRRGHGCMSLVSAVCCQVEVSATGWSLVQRSRTECGVSECDREALSVVCCQVEVSASGWSLVQRSPTECGVSKKCVIVKPREIRRPRPPRDSRAIGKKIVCYLIWARLIRCSVIVFAMRSGPAVQSFL